VASGEAGLEAAPDRVGLAEIVEDVDMRGCGVLATVPAPLPGSVRSRQPWSSQNLSCGKIDIIRSQTDLCKEVSTKGNDRAAPGVLPG